MREPEGKITVVMPTGERMEVLNNLSKSIAENAKAASTLAKVLLDLPQPRVSIEDVVITNVNNSPAISINQSESDKETGVYHWSESGHSRYDYGYPSEIKLEDDGEIPSPYVEEFEDEEEMEVNQQKPHKGLYKRK